MVCSRKDSRVLLGSEFTVGDQVLPGEWLTAQVFSLAVCGLEKSLTLLAPEFSYLYKNENKDQFSNIAIMLNDWHQAVTENFVSFSSGVVLIYMTRSSHGIPAWFLTSQTKLRKRVFISLWFYGNPSSIPISPFFSWNLFFKNNLSPLYMPVPVPILFPFAAPLSFPHPIHPSTPQRERIRLLMGSL